MTHVLARTLARTLARSHIYRCIHARTPARTHTDAYMCVCVCVCVQMGSATASAEGGKKIPDNKLKTIQTLIAAGANVLQAVDFSGFPSLAIKDESGYDLGSTVLPPEIVHLKLLGSTTVPTSGLEGSAAGSEGGGHTILTLMAEARDTMMVRGRDAMMIEAKSPEYSGLGDGREWESKVCAARRLATMNVSQEQITDMFMSMHKDCEFFAHSVQCNPRDDQSFASWGSRLMHLSMVCENKEEKKKYLKQAIEKLDQALVLNADSRTHEGELAVFALGNALYFEFFLEKDNAKAEQSLKNAKKKFEDAIKKEPSNMSYRQMIEQLETAHEQRKAAHELSRLEGKSEEEKKIEIRNMLAQMLVSVVDGAGEAAEEDDPHRLTPSLIDMLRLKIEPLLQRFMEGARVVRVTLGPARSS